MRIWQIDALRGVAVILMVAFHFVFDLTFFFGVPVPGLKDGFWFYAGRMSAILFVGVSGAMSAFSFERNKGGQFLIKSLRRAGRILAAAMLVTAATYFFAKDFTVLFGILHFLAVSVLLAVFFVRLKGWNLLGAVLLLGVSTFWKGSLAMPAGFNPADWRWLEISGSYLLLPLGFPPDSFQSFDYYPLLPWLAVFLAGIGAGSWYFEKIRLVAGKPVREFWPIFANFSAFLQFCGRHSLVIYLGHQPVLLGMLYFWQIYFSNP